MKFLKKLLLFILVLVAAALIAAIFINQDMIADRDIVINKPKQEVFAYIKQLKNQNAFSKWSSMDANMKKEYKGVDGTVGFVSMWDSENSEVGKGEQEITKITEGESIDYALRFIKPMESKSTAKMTTTSINDSTTKVTWGFVGKMNYPFNIFRLFVDVEKSIGDDFATGLSNLKSILEKAN
jgi:Polyketide cyclase / dehydrase and lipid transport